MKVAERKKQFHDLQSLLLTSLRLPLPELNHKARSVAFHAIKTDIEKKMELYYYSMQQKQRDIPALAGEHYSLNQKVNYHGCLYSVQ